MAVRRVCRPSSFQVSPAFVSSSLLNSTGAAAVSGESFPAAAAAPFQRRRRRATRSSTRGRWMPNGVANGSEARPALAGTRALGTPASWWPADLPERAAGIPGALVRGTSRRRPRADLVAYALRRVHVFGECATHDVRAAVTVGIHFRRYFHLRLDLFVIERGHGVVALLLSRSWITLGSVMPPRRRASAGGYWFTRSFATCARAWDVGRYCGVILFQASLKSLSVMSISPARATTLSKVALLPAAAGEEYESQDQCTSSCADQSSPPRFVLSVNSTRAGNGQRIRGAGDPQEGLHALQQRTFRARLHRDPQSFASSARMTDPPPRSAPSPARPGRCVPGGSAAPLRHRTRIGDARRLRKATQLPGFRAARPRSEAVRTGRAAPPRASQHRRPPRDPRVVCRTRFSGPGPR